MRRSTTRSRRCAPARRAWVRRASAPPSAGLRSGQGSARLSCWPAPPSSRSRPRSRRSCSRARSRALLLITFLLVLQACTPARPARRDVVIGLVGEPASVFADEPNARIIAAAVTEQLVRRNSHDELVPRLAVRVPTIENGGLAVVTDDPSAPDGRLIATFELRPDLTWQDGVALTAADVRFAWESDRSAPLGTADRWTADRVERVDVVSDRVVRFTYRANERWDDYALAAHVLPEHVLANATA